MSMTKTRSSSHIKTPLAANPCLVHLSSFFLLLIKVERLSSEEWTFDPSEMLSHSKNLPSFSYIAFYSDVDHEVLPVQSGHRVTLTYNLYFDTESPSNVDSVTAGPGSEFKEALIAALENDAFLPKGGHLGFGLNFKYPVDTMTDLVAMGGRLKGNDATIKSICDELGLVTSLKAIYFSDYSTKMKILTDSIVNFGNREVEGGLALHVLQTHQGKVVEDEEFNRDFLHYWETKQFSPDHMMKVLWVTPLTAASSFSTVYMAYGNEARLAHAYGDLCLIVEVGKGSDRQILPRKRKRSKKDS